MVSGELGNLVLCVFLCHLSFFLDLLVFNAHVVQFSQQSGILLGFILALVIRELQLEVQVSRCLGRLLKLLLQLVLLHDMLTDLLGQLFVLLVEFSDFLVQLLLILRLIVALALLDIFYLHPQLLLKLLHILNGLISLSDF